MPRKRPQTRFNANETWRRLQLRNIIDELTQRWTVADDKRTRLKQTIIDLYSDGFMSQEGAIRAISENDLARA